MKNILAFAVLLATALVSGCSVYRVNPLENNLQINPDYSASEARRPYTALISPFDDQRKLDFSGSWDHVVPVISLGTQWFTPTIHTYPEVTKNSDENPAFIENQFIKGDYTNALPRVLATHLEKSGAFKTVKYASRVDENFDTREFDYLIRGAVKKTDLRVLKYDYGLNFLDIVNFGFLVKLFGAPDEIYTARVTYDLVVIERTTGRQVYKATEEYGPVVVAVGYYYNRKVKTLPPSSGVFTSAIEKGLGETVKAVYESLGQ